MVANRPSKKDSIKVEPTDAEETAVEIKEEEIPKKSLKEIQVMNLEMQAR